MGASAGDDDVIRGDAVEAGDGLTETSIALRRPIAKQHLAQLFFTGKLQHIGEAKMAPIAFT